MRDETREIIGRYDRWKRVYDHLDPPVFMSRQELERELIRILVRHRMTDRERLSILEIGCGAGGNLLQFLRLGFLPENIVGNELLPERVEKARSQLPSAIRLLAGDALDLDIAEDSVDIVFQSLVFSSILDDQYQDALASRMWNWVKPGGAILWYDFVFNNPANPDVRGVPVSRVRSLFPEADVSCRSLTLAPPISRLICKLHPSLYTLFNFLPFLRTHRLCWIAKA